MARQGWVKEQRKELDSLVYTNAFYFKLWRTLLMLANHSDGKVIFNGREIPVSSGQLVTGRDALASVYNRGAKPDQQKEPRSLWRWVKKFESWQMLSIKSTPGYSVISITNWAKYQEGVQQVSSNGPANVQQLSTNKNVENDKNTTTTEERAAAGFYEQNFGQLSPFLIQKIEDWVQDFQDIGADEPMANQILVKGMEIAIARNKRSFGYAEAIYRDWEGRGLNSVAAIEDEQAKFKAAKQSRTGSAQRRSPNTPPPADYEYSDDDLPF